MPIRVQRKRTRGWVTPFGAIYVGRPTMWGNPYETAHEYRRWLEGDTTLPFREPWGSRDAVLASLSELRGRDLCCWCALDRDCHADVLLEMANA